MHTIPDSHPLPLSQGFPTSQADSSQQIAVNLPPASDGPATMTRTGRKSKLSQRSNRAYNPMRGRPREGGRGRTRGSPNYKFREIEKLLDLVEEELPIASKGWRVVGSRFRDWAVIFDNPSRTDRSLELKFKQVGFCFFSSMKQSHSRRSHSL